MKKANLHDSNSFKFSDIYWLLKDKSFYQEVISILKSKHIFDPNIWSFSILHGSKLDFYEMMENQAQYKANSLNTFNYLKLGKMNFIDTFNVLDYSPLINPRVHNIGQHDHNILNKQFKETYSTFLKYCLEKGDLGAKEKLYLACYLIIQDRIKEALKLAETMKDGDYSGCHVMAIQYDYLKAYLSLYNEYPSFTSARELSKKYDDHHLSQWRNLFKQIKVQLDEFDKGDMEDENLDKVNDSV
jgi:hypothetical protein